MKIMKRVWNPYASLLINSLYAVGNCAIGLLSHSWWFITAGAYYAVLSAARFCVMNTARKAKDYTDGAAFARRTTGILLIVLSVCLVGINILSAVKERGTNFHEIVMIAIAVYAFSKITLAIIGIARARQCASQFTKTLRNISFADSVVSIYSLQRSMLVSFPGMKPSEIQLFNVLTGTAAWIIVLFLGINLLGGKYVNMAKSRIVKVAAKITESVTDGYKKVEQGVVDGYKKVEQGVVDGYKKIEQSVAGGYAKIEDKFVDTYLTREGETIEEAKERLRKEKE